MLWSVQWVQGRRDDGGFRGLLILTSILMIYVVIMIRWMPNVEVRRTLRIIARLLDAGVVYVLDIGMV
jgi:hypothetical protein